MSITAEQLAGMLQKVDFNVGAMKVEGRDLVLLNPVRGADAMTMAFDPDEALDLAERIANTARLAKTGLVVASEAPAAPVEHAH
jgi:hypothetical protein